jgi:hypothetical protein
MAFTSPAATRHCRAWQWLAIASSSQQKQQQHHQQLTNSSTILKTFTFPEKTYLNLSTVYFGLFLVQIY